MISSYRDNIPHTTYSVEDKNIEIENIKLERRRR